MTAQLDMRDMLDADALWSAGIELRCPRDGGDCRFTPCTTAQEVRCCAACIRCVNPCEKVR